MNYNFYWQYYKKFQFSNLLMILPPKNIYCYSNIVLFVTLAWSARAWARCLGPPVPPLVSWCGCSCLTSSGGIELGLGRSGWRAFGGWTAAHIRFLRPKGRWWASCAGRWRELLGTPLCWAPRTRRRTTVALFYVIVVNFCLILFNFFNLN